MNSNEPKWRDCEELRLPTKAHDGRKMAKLCSQPIDNDCRSFLMMGSRRAMVVYARNVSFEASRKSDESAECGFEGVFVNKTILSLVAILAAGNAVFAQGLPSRVGLNVGLVKLQGSDNLAADQGYMIGMGIHFAREERHEQRLRIEFIQMKEDTGRFGSGSVEVNAAAFGVGYDYMPSLAKWENGGSFHLVAGVGYQAWAQKVDVNVPYYYSENATDTASCFAPTLGVHVRFNRHFGLELRQTWSKVSLTTDEDFFNEDFNHLTFSANIRF